MPNKFYVTTSIAYVNAKPHIGYAMELVQADVLARYHRLKGDDVYYLTGTDEHGMKLAQTAKDQGIEPKQLVDKNADLFRGLTGNLNISNDFFVRTSDEFHKKGAQKLWKQLVEAGDIYEDEYEGLYCVGCEAFVLEKDLIDGKCPNHNKEPELLKEKNFFFKLSKYSEKIGQLIESDELKVVPESKKNEILEVIKDGLRDVSFSRPKSVLTWGIDVPDQPDQVMYVWCDALSNYITAIGYENDDAKFKKYWPADVHVIGKDILRFHSAIWIGMLLSANLPLPKAIYVHGHITSEGKKMSKSLNNVVDPNEFLDKYGIDALRYYLLKEIPTTDDGDFSRERFDGVYNGELANNIGNLVSRVLAMNGKYFDSKVPEPGRVNNLCLDETERTWKAYEAAIAEFDLKKALELINVFADFANKYVEESKPWVLAKEDEEKLAGVLYDLLELIRHLSLMIYPFIPQSAEKILGYLHLKAGDYEQDKKWGQLKPGNPTEKAEPLFAKLLSNDAKS